MGSGKRIVIIGGVAGGASYAAKAGDICNRGFVMKP